MCRTDARPERGDSSGSARTAGIATRHAAGGDLDDGGNLSPTAQPGSLWPALSWHHVGPGLYEQSRGDSRHAGTTMGSWRNREHGGASPTRGIPLLHRLTRPYCAALAPISYAVHRDLSRPGSRSLGT